MVSPVFVAGFDYSGCVGGLADMVENLARFPNPGKRTEANEILRYVVIGLVLAFAAWLIVNTILELIVNTEHYDIPLEN